ncbi:MAG: WD40/YVTN/BNR-like repeat-containing protein [Actinomycetota bacterium]
MILVGTEKGLLDADSGDTLLPGSIDAISQGAHGLWAVADGYRILSSPDARTWTETAMIRGLRANCVLANDGGALVGTSEAHVIAVTGGSATRVRSFDRVPTRDSWYTPWGGPPDTRSLSRDADGGVYANVHVGGILRSTDGASWRATSMDVDADVHQILAHPTESRLAFAATAIGLASTADAGNTWEFTEDGLHAAYCRAVAIAGDTLLLSASQTHTGRKCALYRRGVAGGTFERCSKGLPEWFADNVDTYCLAADGDRAVIGTSDGLVFGSEDAGRSWSELRTGVPSITCVTLT